MSVNGEVGAGEGETPQPRGIGFLELFLAFLRLGVSSFGGGLPAWFHRAFVERRRWLSETEFAAAFALARIVPGVNVVNLAVLIGHRARGAAGSVAAVSGLLLGPSLAVVGLAVLYDRFAGAAILQVALEGAATAAVGLLIAMGAVSGSRLVGGPEPGRQAARSLSIISKSGARFSEKNDACPKRSKQDCVGRPTQSCLGAIAIAAGTFILIGVLRFPTVQTLLCLAPISIALAYVAARPSSTEKPDGGR